MAGRKNFSNAASGTVFGSSCPLLGADFNEHSDPSEPSSQPVSGDAATAPPSYLMDYVSEYEGTSTGDHDGNFLPRPTYPDSGPRNDFPLPDVQCSIPSISEDTAKESFVQYAKSKCCYSSAPAKKMEFQDFKAFNTYRYRLETFIESRSSEWQSVPYNGEVIDVHPSGAVPPLWDLPVPVVSLFQDNTENFKVPHTSSVKPCQTCLSMGQNICQMCHGSGRVQCCVCNGTRMRSNDRCTNCQAIGNTCCNNCGGCGRTICTVCKGKRQLLTYLQLKVSWKNYIFEFLDDKNTGFPPDLFKEVTGQKVFEDEQLLVCPLTTFPDPLINQASMNAIQRHASQFVSTGRIVRQRQIVELIPLTKVDYTWKSKSCSYFVYGVENRVFTDDYPAKCCCCVM